MSFDGYMPYGSLPFFIIIGIWRYVKSHSFAVKGNPCQRHVAFPADKDSHRAPSVWTTGKNPLSASPHTTLSVPVGLSLRWIAASLPSGEKKRFELYNVAETLSRSDTPMLTYTPFSPASCGDRTGLFARHQDRIVVIKLPVFSAVFIAAANGEPESHSHKDIPARTVPETLSALLLLKRLPV